MSDQREHILACACDLYLENGLDGFSMRKLARRVGVTAPALYRHFGGKEAVLADVVREAYSEFTRRLYRALEGPTPLDRFVAAGDGYLDFALEHPRWYAIMFSAPEQLGMDALPEDLEAMGCAVHQFWVDRVRECMDAGVLEDGDPVQASITMWAHAHGMIQLHHQGHFRMEEADFRALVDQSCTRMLRGLATADFANELTERCLGEVSQAATSTTNRTGTWPDER